MRLIQIDEGNFPDYWPSIDPLLSRCCERSRGRFSVESSLKNLAESKWQFWVGIDEKTKVKVFGVSEILPFDTGLRVLNIIMVGGRDTHSWRPLLDTVADWGKSQGCGRIQAWGHPGWRKMLDDWTCDHILLERAL